MQNPQEYKPNGCASHSVRTVPCFHSAARQHARLMIVCAGLGLLMGTRMWYQMWDAASDDDVAFERRMDGICRELGDRAKLKVPEAVPPEPTLTPAPAPEPARASALVSHPKKAPAAASAALASSLAPAPTPTPASPSASAPTPTPAPTSTMAAPTEVVGPARTPTPQTQFVSSVGIEAQGSFSEMVIFMRQEREHMEAKLEAQRHEMEQLQQKAFESETERLTPQEAISAAQVDALMARLEALHAAKLLSDDEFFAIEDLVMDFVEARAALGVVTMQAVNTNHVVGKVHKLVAVSEVARSDATLARQLKRKFV